MRLDGLSLGGHIRRLAPLFGLILAVWVLRLVADAAGMPPGLVRGLSVTAASAVSVLLAVILIHVRDSGGYPSVVLASLMLVGFGHLLIVAAVAFGVLTGTSNIFTAPEFSMPFEDPYHLRHIYGHLTFGIGLGGLFGALVGCALLWLLRGLLPASSGR